MEMQEGKKYNSMVTLEKEYLLHSHRGNIFYKKRVKKLSFLYFAHRVTWGLIPRDPHELFHHRKNNHMAVSLNGSQENESNE